MNPRVLVIYATTDGHTAKVAQAIAATLGLQGVKVDLGDANGWDPDPGSYAAVVMAASVHAGGYQRSIRQWARRHAAGLRGMPTAFISVCLAVLNRTPKVDRDLSAILDRFVAQTGWQPGETKAVAGALRYTRYGFLKRWMMRRIVAKQHGDTDTSRDYEYTDWDDLAAFTRRFGSAALVAAGDPFGREHPVSV